MLALRQQIASLVSRTDRLEENRKNDREHMDERLDNLDGSVKEVADFILKTKGGWWIVVTFLGLAVMLSTIFTGWWHKP